MNYGGLRDSGEMGGDESLVSHECVKSDVGEISEG